MKTLAVMNFLQFAILVFLFGKVASIENELHKTANIENDIPWNSDIYEPPVGAAWQTSYDSSSEPLLRRIFREELATQLAALRMADSQSAAVLLPEPVDDAQYQQQIDLVTQELDVFESVGTISKSDMYELQSKIMALNQTDQRKALRRLVKALNTGTLKGWL